MTDDLSQGAGKVVPMGANVSRHPESDLEASVPLGPEVAAAVDELATAHTRGELGFLVGAGMSVGAGLPTWDEVLRELIRQRYLGARPPEVAALSIEEAEESYRTAFPNPLSLARALSLQSGPQFVRDLATALYGPESARIGPDATPFEPPVPLLHLVALAGRMSSQPDAVVHTLNFDDLLDRAARQVFGSNQSSTQTRHRMRARRGLTIAHLHGIVGQDGRAEGLVFTEHDYHMARSAQSSWIYRETMRLFEQHSVLMLGISLADPNVRQVLDLATPGDSPGTPHHVVWATSPDEGTDPVRFAARQLERNYWERLGVRVVRLRSWGQLPAFIVALRDRASELAGRPLLAAGYRHLLSVMRRNELADLWKPQIRRKAGRQLQRLESRIRAELGIPADCELRCGIFVPTSDGVSLDLPFRSDESSCTVMAPGYRRLEASPRAPQGIAGLAYAAGTLIRARRDSPLWDYGLGEAARSQWTATSQGGYESVASAPVFDWDEGSGEPLGVAYVTSSRADTFETLSPAQLRVLEETLLGEAMARVIWSLRRT